MSAQHTPGPIRYDYAPGYCGELIASNGHTVATFVDEPSPEDASRLVACWNACEGIPLDALEAMPSGPAALLPMYARLEAQHDELLKSVRSIAAITTCADQGSDAMCAEIQGICREALAKATAECEANARPIAATPDLLEAAIELKDVCNRPSAARTRAEAWRKLDKAIAKATGGTA